MSMPAHQTEQSAILATNRIEALPATKEMMIDQPDDMKPFGDNPGIGEGLANDGPIG